MDTKTHAITSRIPARTQQDGIWIPTSWQRASTPVHIDPETYVPQVSIPDEVLTRMIADRYRPHSIPDRPAPMPDPDDVDFVNDLAFWEYAEELRLCGQCNEPFLAQAHNHRYCSSKCQSLSVIKTSVCDTCGNEYTSRFSSQRYCSQQCAGRAKRSSEYEGVCAWCSTEFRATRKEQRFCSRECYNVERRSRAE
jgi:hypothetical protein